MPSSRGLSRENERPRQTISKRKSVCRGFLYFFKKFFQCAKTLLFKKIFQCAKTLHIGLIPFSHQRKGGETGESKRTQNAAYRRAVRTQIRHNRQSGVRTRRVAQNDLLRQRKFDTIDNLAFELGVSRRTICYDIEELSLSYPIFTAKGTGGGVWVRDGYRLGRRYLTEKQRELLERLSAGLTAKDAEIMESILSQFTLAGGKRTAGK